MPQLSNESDPNIRLNANYESWFAVISHIMAMFITFPGGILSSCIGRRKVILLTIPFVIIGWILVGLAENKFMLFAGRILGNIILYIFLILIISAFFGILQSSKR